MYISNHSKMKCPLFVVLILTIANISFGVELQVKYSWKFLDYSWTSPLHKFNAIRFGDYIKTKNVLLDVDEAPDGRTFVTAVRDKGVPASLMTVTNKMGVGGPLLAPYPNWSWYKNTDCDSIISVYRVHIKCNYIYVLDCGKIIGSNKTCPPKLLIFDLRNDRLVKRIVIPPHIATNKKGTGLFVTPFVYVEDCKYINDATVFMADILGYGLVKYNEKFGFCRIESKYMKPTHPNFVLERLKFYLSDGILGITNIRKELLYAPLAGNKILKMNMRDLRKCSKLNERETDRLTKLAGTLSNQTGPIASQDCAIFFSNVADTSIMCADASKEFNSNKTETIVQDSKKLQFVSGMKVVEKRWSKKLLAASNRLHLSFYGKLNVNDINFRIFQMDIAQIRKHTNCFASCYHQNT